MRKDPSVGRMLTRFAKSLEGKKLSGTSFSVNLIVNQASWNLAVAKGKASLKLGPSSKADFVIRTDLQTLRSVYAGMLNGLTALAKASDKEHSPIDVEFPRAKPDAQTLRSFYWFVRHFFNRTWPESIHVSEKESRRIHGGHAVPLFYDTGFRSAWYMLSNGERLNEPGSTNPFPQGIFVVSGTGKARMAGRSLRLSRNHAYYIPPETEHYIANDSRTPLCLIWFGWGTQA